MRYVSIPAAVCGAILMMLTTGCASSGQASESTRAVESMQDAYTSLGKATAQVNKTVALLDQLTSGQDLPKTFQQYTQAVNDMRMAGERAAQRGKDLRERKADYLKKWEKEIKDIQDPTIRQASAERQSDIRASYDKLLASAEGIRDSYKPFLQHLQEVQKALSVDLTAAGVSSIAPVISTVKQDGKKLSSALDAFGVELNRFTGTLKPAT
jgi:hypothetical protein